MSKHSHRFSCEYGLSRSLSTSVSRCLTNYRHELKENDNTLKTSSSAQTINCLVPNLNPFSKRKIHMFATEIELKKILQVKVFRQFRFKVALIWCCPM